MNKKSLFDILKDLTYNKVEYDPELNYSQYMVNRFISMCEAYIPIAEEVNRSNIPDSAHYNYYKKILPKRQTYLKYIGKAKEDSEYNEMIECITKYFKISPTDAKDYYEFLKPEDKDKIKAVFNPEYAKSSISKKRKK